MLPRKKEIISFFALGRKRLKSGKSDLRGSKSKREKDEKSLSSVV
jgi:hypothetical protein